VVWIPNAAEPRPLLLAAHGAGGSPEWHCAFWAEAVGAGAFVLCPRGRPYDQSGLSFYFAQHHDLGDRVAAALQAFEATHAGNWLGRHSVFVGYSQGATMGALLLPGLGAEFEFALLIEGGYEQWPVSNAREFRAGGGRRAFFACGTASCKRGATRSVRWLEKGGIEASQATADGAGHTPAGAVGEIARNALTWLVRDSQGWEDFARSTAERLTQEQPSRTVTE
jgi:predicted esterase